MGFVTVTGLELLKSSIRKGLNKVITDFGPHPTVGPVIRSPKEGARHGIRLDLLRNGGLGTVVFSSLRAEEGLGGRLPESALGSLVEALFLFEFGGCHSIEDLG